jgi:flagellar M-ring protein FliF
MAMADRAYKNIVENIRSWPLSRKLALGGVAGLSLILFAFIILQSHKAEYRPLYTDLPREEAASVTAWLKEQAVSYKLEDQGRSIYVPADVVYETRLDLAGAGLPRQGGVGFEIFDKQNFGVTKFTQKINYQRALQGELSRTIAALAAVKSARVHVVLPEKRLLSEQQEEAKASVVVDLEDGQGLHAAQTQGIIHLVAGSIEGLAKNRITVIDTAGRTLSRSGGEDPGLAMLPEQLKFKSTLETRLENRVQTLLDRAMGHGNSVVRITADLDFTQEAITTEEYDPDSLVPRSEKITESESGYKTSGGVPGVQSNLNDDRRLESGAIPSSKSSELINYEINKTVKRIKSPVGKINQLTAAVLVADAFDPAANGGKGAHVPLSADKIASVRKMVETAIGLDADRGDRIEVVSMPFEQAGRAATAPAETGSVYDYVPYVKYLLLLVCAVLLYLALVRPMVKTLRQEALPPAPATAGALEDAGAHEAVALDGPAKLRLEIANSSVTPAQVVKTWLKEG